MAKEYLRRADLIALGIATSNQQLQRMMEQQSFPRGFLLSPQVRLFPREEVEAWIEERREAGRQAAAAKSETHRERGIRGGRAKAAKERKGDAARQIEPEQSAPG